MEVFGIKQAREVLGVCVDMQNRQLINYNFERKLKEVESDVSDLRYVVLSKTKTTVIIGMVTFIALIAAIVFLCSEYLATAVTFFVVTVIFAIDEIPNIVALVKKYTEYKSAVKDYTYLTSPEKTNERNAKIAENLKVIEECKRKLAYANEIYGEDTNYVQLYNESKQCLTTAGRMASEIIRAIDDGIVNNIPSAVQYIKQKEQTDALIEAQKLNAEAQIESAKASLLIAEQVANAANSSAKAASATQKALDRIDRNTRDY